MSIAKRSAQLVISSALLTVAGCARQEKPLGTRGSHAEMMPNVPEPSPLPKPPSRESLEPFGVVAVDFALALVEGDFARAHRLLGPELQSQFSVPRLRDRYRAMYEGYAHGEPMSVHYERNSFRTEWPTRQAKDVGLAYIGIMGDSFMEAVMVIVADVDGSLLVREIQWGRP